MINPIVREEFKYITTIEVPGVVEYRYVVSNFGYVIDTNNNKNRIVPLVPDDYKLPNPWYRVSLKMQDGEYRYQNIQRIVMIAFNLVCNYEDLQVDHINGNKKDNCITNLRWVTCRTNILLSYQNNQKIPKRGEDVATAVITNKQAEDIAKLLLTQKYSQQEIADIVGCPVYIVSNISSGATWQWVYYKYNLESVKKSINKMSDEDLKKLCQYFQDNKSKYTVMTDLYRAALKDLFDIEYNNSMGTTLSRYLHKRTRKNITGSYDF